MTCPRCHTAGAWHFVQPPKFNRLEKAPKNETPYPEVLRPVKRPLGVGNWECSFCHYERSKGE